MAVAMSKDSAEREPASSSALATSDTGALDPARASAFVASLTSHAVFSLDVEGRITSANVGAERLTGYRAEELIGVPAAHLYTPEDVAAGAPAEVLRRAQSEGRIVGEG